MHEQSVASATGLASFSVQSNCPIMLWSHECENDLRTIMINCPQLSTVPPQSRSKHPRVILTTKSASDFACRCLQINFEHVADKLGML